MPYPDTRHRLTDLLKQFGVAALYALLIFLDHRYFENGTTVTSPFEPASGFALAVLLIGGKRYAWGVFLGAILINILEAPFWEAAIISSAEALEAFCGAWLLTRDNKFSLAIQSLRDYLRLTLMGGVVGTGIGAHTVTTALLVSGFIAPEAFSGELIHWWSGDLLGVILVTPLILVCQQTKNDWHGAKRVTEAVLLLGLTFLAGQIIFLGWPHTTDGLFEQVAKGYWIFLCMVWVAVRLGTRGAVITMNVAAIQGLLGAYHEVGFFADDIALTQLVNYWFFMATLSVVGMALATFITERKQSEELLLQSKERLRAYLDNISDTIWVIDANLGMAYASSSVTRLLGFLPDELIGRPSALVIHPDDMGIIDDAMRYVIEHPGEPKTIQYRVKHKDGRWIPVESTGINLLDNPAINGVLIVMRDITERKRAQSILMESESRFRQIFNAVSDAIFIHDAETGRIIDVNDRMCEMYGFTREEALACGVSDLSAGTPPYSVTDAAEKIRLAHTVGQQTFDWLARARDGHLFWVEVSLRLALIDNQQRILALVRDITERKAVEQRLHELSTHILDVREEEKARIAREIHDELGGTLTALKIDVHWLSRRLPARDETMALIERIKSISRRIDDAVSATRQIIDNMRPTILDDLGLLAAIEWQTAEFCKNTGVECRVSCIEDEANLDKQRSIALFRILQEALTNVSRHSGASRVEITFLHNESEVVLTVCDNGRGMRENHTSASKSYGMLGMTERIEQLGGKITFGNPPDGGFCVEAFLPLPADNKGEKT